jgi:hypothetical protein
MKSSLARNTTFSRSNEFCLKKGPVIRREGHLPWGIMYYPEEKA